jgi:hypothetical protein
MVRVVRLALALALALALISPPLPLLLLLLLPAKNGTSCTLAVCRSQHLGSTMTMRLLAPSTMPRQKSPPSVRASHGCASVCSAAAAAAA